MRKRYRKQEADLDITSFMNLMIILVPVLLMSMVFSHITVLDIRLPDNADSENTSSNKNKILELVINEKSFLINYPAGSPLQSVPNTKQGAYDYALLATTLKDIKQLLVNKDIKKRDILILSQPNTDYQTIVKVMDTVRSYKTVIATSVVEAELFPAISLGDAPKSTQSSVKEIGGGR